MLIQNIVFRPLGSMPDDKLRFAVIAARCEGQWLFCRHRQRTTWEIPGGHIEPGETALEAARRELREETGAIDFELTPVCIYGVVRENSAGYGLLCFAQVKTLGPLDPQMEIGEVARMSALPENLTYPAIQPALYDHIQGWLNLQSSPDEIWDVYDKDRNLTGRTHRRGDPLAPGDYHLAVHMYVRRPTGEFLITQRAPTKGFPLLWESTGGSAEAGETSLEAALREIREETGLCAAPENAQLLLQMTRQDHHLDVYAVTLDFELDDVVLQAGETVDKRLVSKEELMQLWESGAFVPHGYMLELMDKL